MSREIKERNELSHHDGIAEAIRAMENMFRAHVELVHAGSFNAEDSRDILSVASEGRRGMIEAAGYQPVGAQIAKDLGMVEVPSDDDLLDMLSEYAEDSDSPAADFLSHVGAPGRKHDY